MTPEAYEHFTTLSKKDFAAAKARGERLSLAEGERIAEEAWKNLPSGQQTPGHHFFTAWNNNQDIGMVWFKEERNWETPYAFLYQIWIWDEFQGQGLGKELMGLFEAEVQKLGLKRIRLHVFAYNRRAHEMYLKLGFEETNVVMVKEI